MSEFLLVLSEIVGWLYFTAWSVSFYPQIFINYKLKHVRGYSFNFGVLNLIGFLAYSIYSIWGYLDPSIMPGSVGIQDIAFALHAFLLMAITLLQCGYYDSLWRRTDLWVKIVGSTFILAGVICASVQLAHKMPEFHNWNGCLALGYMKVLISVMKYMPQVYRNWKRKSTVGWSIENILLDFSGGILSILQIFIDGANTGDWNVFNGGGSFNIAKFLLGFASMLFDIVFIVQHFILYSKPQPNKESSNSLILQI